MEMNLTEKASYLKGLAEGLELDKESKEGKIIAALLDLTGEMAQELAKVRNDIDEIDDDLDYLNDYVEELEICSAARMTRTTTKKMTTKRMTTARSATMTATATARVATVATTRNTTRSFARPAARRSALTRS